MRRILPLDCAAMLEQCSEAQREEWRHWLLEREGIMAEAGVPDWQDAAWVAFLQALRRDDYERRLHAPD